MNRTLFQIYSLLLLLPALAMVCSCQDELYQGLDYTSVGEDVAFTVHVGMPSMDVKSRADISDQNLNEVKSLWIAVFNANTGVMTSRPGNRNTIGWIKVTPPTNYNNYTEDSYQNVTLYAKTGPSYIVAVANVDNEGVTSDAPNVRQKLGELLADGLTWEEFSKIAVVSFAAGGNAYDHVVAPDVECGLPMSGCFSSLAVGGTHPDGWEAANVTPVQIPASGSTAVTLSGAIHLRRLVSHIRFNIKPGRDVSDVSIESFSVFNMPSYSWLYERGNDSGGTGCNFGDRARDAADASAYYHPQVQFGAHNVAVSDAGVSTFDFWQVENKHTGTIVASDKTGDGKKLDEYNQREVKSLDGDNVLYTALTGGTWSANNMASYVTIRCDVAYKDQINVDGNGYATENGSGNEVYRMGVAEYTVHLGYMNADATDFNSRRNTNYTYNITINGLNEIVVEANDDGTRNAVEGLVTDVDNANIRLDAHFSAFNIVFTEAELRNKENFGYLVTSYASGSAYTFTESSEVGDDERKYLDWVELKPTVDATTLAAYVPARGDYSGTEERVMPIDEFYSKVITHVDNLEDVFIKNADGNYYFTVFVNEYTYEPRYGESNWGEEDVSPVWDTYVNQPPRRFYFKVQIKESEDRNSIYARSKYSIEQQSVQTYYSSTVDVPTAIGLEHINEAQGLNLRNLYSIGSNVSHVNGRWNVAQWIASKPARRWSDFVTPSAMLKVKAPSSLQGGRPFVSIASGWNPASGDPSDTGFGNLPAIKSITEKQYSDSVNKTNTYNRRNAYDPQANSTSYTDYIEALNACMNRNRDENGNGIIDNEELKWYVPASGKYLRAILGRNALLDPIMPYLQIASFSADNSHNTRWMLFASDCRVAWAMEGLSMSEYYDRNNREYGSRIPWNVRCIRNLGTSLKTIENREKVDMAYTHTPKSGNNTYGRIVMSYYDHAAIRTTKITTAGNGANNGMAVHPVTDAMNKVYYAFEYDDLANTGSTTYNPNTIVTNFFANNSNNPCYKKGDNWRLPNQKELAIMRSLGLFDNVPNNYYAICCTYDYFTTDGKGTDQGVPSYSYNNGVPTHRLIATRNDGGTRWPASGSRRVYYRCVRDVNP